MRKRNGQSSRAQEDGNTQVASSKAPDPSQGFGVAGKPRRAATLITDDPTTETNIRAGLPKSATLDSGKSEKSNPWFIVIALMAIIAGFLLPFFGLPSLAGLLAIKVTSLAAASVSVMATINAGLFLAAAFVLRVLAAAFVGGVWGKKPQEHNTDDYTLLAGSRSRSDTDLDCEVDDKNKPKTVSSWYQDESGQWLRRLPSGDPEPMTMWYQDESGQWLRRLPSGGPEPMTITPYANPDNSIMGGDGNDGANGSPQTRR